MGVARTVLNLVTESAMLFDKPYGFDENPDIFQVGEFSTPGDGV